MKISGKIITDGLRQNYGRCRKKRKNFATKFSSGTFYRVSGRIRNICFGSWPKKFRTIGVFLSWHEPRRDFQVLRPPLMKKREIEMCLSGSSSTVCSIFCLFCLFCFFSARFPPAGLSAAHFHADWLPMIGARQPGWLSSWYFLLLLIQLRKYLNTMRARRNQPIQWPSWVVVAVTLWSVMSTLIGEPGSSGL